MRNFLRRTFRGQYAVTNFLASPAELRSSPSFNREPQACVSECV